MRKLAFKVSKNNCTKQRTMPGKKICARMSRGSKKIRSRMRRRPVRQLAGKRDKKNCAKKKTMLGKTRRAR